MKQSVLLSILIIGLFLLSSCTTYFISLESFKQQFAGIDSSKFKDVVVQGPVITKYYYKANPITTINCTDKDGKPAELKNSPSIEIRFTYGENNKRTVFYFDRVFVDNNSVTGVESRFIQSIRKTIPLDSIKKIEVQDGKKKFSYVDKH